MMKRLITLCIASLLVTFSCGLLYAQSAGSDAVILSSDESFTYRNPSDASYSSTKTIRILSREGDDIAVFSRNVNKGCSKLKSFSGEIRNAEGKTIRKLKKSDLKSTEYSNGLADSYETFYYTPIITSYPCEVVYSYEIQYTDGILGFDPFVPLPYTGKVSLVKAEYTLSVPTEKSFSYKELNIPPGGPRHSSSGGSEVFKWTITDISNPEAENYSLPRMLSTPVVLFSPSEFSYEGAGGSMRDWNSLGKWLYSLMDGRGSLPPALKEKVKEITDGAETDAEKIKAVYDYLGKTTRYVSIQLGLGGFRPASPSKVYENKFGDCKALSFYLKSMLESIGIASDYAITNSGEDRMLPDFPSPWTANHAILSIPSEGDTLWVECTNPDIPLGFIHSGIAGNHVLVVKEEGSFVTKIPQHSDGDNFDNIIAEVALGGNGEAEGKVEEKGGGLYWEYMSSLEKLHPEKRADVVAGGVSAPVVKIENLTFQDDHSRNPVMTLSYDISAPSFASATGKRLFVPINPFRDKKEPVEKGRKTPLYFNETVSQKDSIVFLIPNGYAVEAIEEPFSFENRFGKVCYNYTSDGRHILLTFEYLRRKGVFAPDDFDLYKEFQRRAEKIFSSKIILVK